MTRVAPIRTATAVATATTRILVQVESHRCIGQPTDGLRSLIRHHVAVGIERECDYRVTDECLYCLRARPALCRPSTTVWRSEWKSSRRPSLSMGARKSLSVLGNCFAFDDWLSHLSRAAIRSARSIRAVYRESGIIKSGSPGQRHCGLLHLEWKGSQTFRASFLHRTPSFATTPKAILQEQH